MPIQERKPTQCSDAIASTDTRQPLDASLDTTTRDVQFETAYGTTVRLSFVIRCF